MVFRLEGHHFQLTNRIYIQRHVAANSKLKDTFVLRLPDKILPFDGAGASAGLEDTKQPLGHRLLEALLGLHPKEALFETRGFSTDVAGARHALEAAAGAFVQGYNAALKSDPLGHHLTKAPSGRVALRGFYLEGAAMGLALTDALPFRVIAGARLDRFLALTSSAHPYLASVGAGWAMAKTPWRSRAILDALDPLLALLAFDGLGFHDCFFWPQRLHSGPNGRVAKMGGTPACGSWDRGAGRSAWFSRGADVGQISDFLQMVAPARRDNLAAGVGLAACYAGGSDPSELSALTARLPMQRSWLSQGAAFALEAHERAGTGTYKTRAAFTAITGMNVDEGLEAVRRTRPEMPAGADLATAFRLHDRWRLKLANALQRH